MSDVAIRVNNLSKKYLIGKKQEKYGTLRDTLVQVVSTPARRIQKLMSGNAAGASDLSEEIWALKDVSFEVKHGDVVGIIGRNGAGKSTLLKILSQITEPTSGQVEMYGRVGALLEVGTGFHSELTGRENVFLNGAILGMTRREIERKFDEIVDFSGIEKFIDTPVKHYSSGMQMRLAFAVAANLEPEILIVDEVLAVGDAEFQKKCLGKMDEVAKGGRTVLFVSHNLGAVGELCQKGVVIEKGRLELTETADVAIRHYLNKIFSQKDTKKVRETNKLIFIKSFEINSVTNEYCHIQLEIQSSISANIGISFRLRDMSGHPIAYISRGELDANRIIITPGENHLSLKFDITQFAIGRYILDAFLTQPNIEYYDQLMEFLIFDINYKSLSQLKTSNLVQSGGFGSFDFPLLLA
ncbi:MAG TPA: ABC transporter ATP-binding protein [Anaerolineales bacterium]|nr:ABC transporter ATP-binding protein [Anaerolineales bacterium]